MPNVSRRKATYRIIDANINRLKEGLRVCEEVARFILDNKPLTREFKKIRHRIDAILKRLPASREFLKERDSESDAGRRVYANELKRKSHRDILFANLQRVKESVRVLEEFTKLINAGISVKFKELRYDIYALEKKVAGRIPPLCYRR